MDLDIIINGVAYSLSDGTYCQHLGHNGVGMMPSHRLRQRGPMQHGSTDLGFRGDPRTVQLALLIEGTSMSDYWTRRTALLNLFKPIDNPLGLRFTLDNGDVRQLDCEYVGDMNLSSAQKMRYTHAIGVTLSAAEPSFYDPTGKSITFALGGGSAAFEIPMAIPLNIGVSALDQTRMIDYGGDARWLALPYRIRIVGPITDAVITNLAIDEKLDFTSVTIAAGNYYDIDCRYSEKTIIDSNDANKIADLTNDSDLITWHLAPSPDVTDGLNDIRVTGSTVTAATEIYIQWFDKFVGI